MLITSEFHMNIYYNLKIEAIPFYINKQEQVDAPAPWCIYNPNVITSVHSTPSGYSEDRAGIAP
jgi:hypothetical protein